MNPDEKRIEEHQRAIWDMIDTLEVLPRYPCIVRRLDITASEEEYFDHELSFEEKYDETLQLREGFIVAALDQKQQLLGVGDCVILDIEKRTMLRAPRVKRCGLILPMISYQGSIQQPQDYLTYSETMQQAIQGFATSHHKKTLRCWQEGLNTPSTSEAE